MQSKSKRKFVTLINEFFILASFLQFLCLASDVMAFIGPEFIRYLYINKLRWIEIEDIVPFCFFDLLTQFDKVHERF